MRPLRLRDGEREVVANLRLPLPFDNARKYPALVCVGPRGSLAGTSEGYGAGLTRRGYITLALDAVSAPNNRRPASDSSPQAAGNANGAIEFLMRMDIVDKHHVGLVGIGGGLGYAVEAARTDDRILALATVAAVGRGSARREDISSQPARGAFEAAGAVELAHPPLPGTSGSTIATEPCRGAAVLLDSHAEANKLSLAVQASETDLLANAALIDIAVEQIGAFFRDLL